MKIIFKKSGKGILLILISSLIILPFGNVLAYGTNYQYTGQEKDVNSNLYYYGQRYYDPNVGRFTQPDPVSKYLNDPQKLNKATGQDLQKLLENPQALNEYSYTQNNPIKYTDPNGETIRQVITGEQSFSDYQVEVGGGGEVLYNEGGIWKGVMDHPIATGAMLGVGIPLVASRLGSLILKGLISSGLISTPIVSSGFDVTKTFNNLNKAAQGAYEIALKGGQNYRLLENIKKIGMTFNQLQRGINSLEQNALEHLNYIKDPSIYPKYSEFINLTAEQQQRTLNEWSRQASSFLQQVNVLKGYLNNLHD